MKKMNLSMTPMLVATRPYTLRIRSRVKAAMVSLNHNEIPSRPRSARPVQR